ncbi:COP9 signalosome complex subunit 1b [Drosophila eugracilis]|uniref:COP9 signalosome complex subunit 1b n=1 Tax=Drosophila eugracilis TaxID=29029 RepID=UPI0007E67D54|nr:COP9 signalosome complex subunit 1b [Drosophila eugracilis]
MDKGSSTVFKSLSRMTDNEEAMQEGAVLHLPSYADRYTDIPRLIRLKFIAQVCPQLSVPALELAIAHVKTTFNVKLYDELYKTLCIEMDRKTHKNLDERGAFPTTDGNEQSTSRGRGRRLVPYDSYWVEDNTMEANLALQELDAELNFKKSNSGSSYVRRTLEEIGDHYEKSGNLQRAVKFYARARSYCTSSDNVINMFRNLIRVSIYMANWWHVLTYIDEAKQYAFGFENLCQEVPARLSCAAGLANMGLKLYKSAAQYFLNTSFGRYDYDKIVAPEDVPFYAGLCALATYDRDMLQLRAINSESFKPFFQLSPKMWTILAKFYEGQFDTCSALLGDIEDHVRIDVYLSPHVDTLYDMIMGRLKKNDKKVMTDQVTRHKGRYRL